MTELIGIGAGAVTFGTVAAQLTSSVSQLKNCWEQIRDAPEDLKWLIRDIELFGIVLAEAEEEWGRESVPAEIFKNTSAAQSLRFCKEAAEELGNLVKDLERDLDSSNISERSYAAPRMAMQEEKVEEYRSRLKKVVGLLIVSQQCYKRALVHTQHELIAKGVSGGTYQSTNCGSDKSVIDTEGSDYVVTIRDSLVDRRNPPYTSRSSFSWRLEMPTWMTSKALELAGLKAPHGWKFAFRAYNIISINSAAVKAVERNDFTGIQELFASRQATPFDRININGFNLLHYVGASRSHEMFKFLLDQGADPLIEGDFSRSITPLSHLVWSGSQADGYRPLLPSMRVLLPYSEVPIYETHQDTTAVDSLLTDFHGTAEEFIFLQQECCPTYFQMPQYTRVAVAASMASGFHDALHMPDLVLTALGTHPRNIDTVDLEHLATSREIGKTTLLHSIARKMGKNLADLYCPPLRSNGEHIRDKRLLLSRKLQKAILRNRDARQQRTKSLYESWKLIFFELLDAGVDIHKVAGRSTPFSAFLLGYFQSVYSDASLRTCNAAIKVWLEDLQTAGINLQEFGEIEERLLSSGAVDKQLDSMRGWYTGTPRITGFTYGSSPADWHLWISEGQEMLVGNFWRLVKRQEEVMPGAWPDDAPYRLAA